MGTITIPGSTGQPVTIGSGTNNLASAIGYALSTVVGGVTAQTVTAAGPLPAASLAGVSSVAELLITGSESINASIPAGYKVVGVYGSTPATLSGSDVEIVVGSVGGTYSVSGNSSVAALGASTITASGNFVVNASGSQSVVDANGSGSVSVAGSSTVVASGTSTNINASGSNNVIGLGDGNAAVNLTGSNSTIFGGAGSFQATVAGSGTDIGLSSGTAVLAVSGDANTVFGGAGLTQANITGDNDVLGGGSGAIQATITGNSAQIYADDGITIALATGDGDEIHGSSGSINATLQGSNDAVGGSSGSSVTTTVLMTGDAASVFSGGDNAILIANLEGTNAVVGMDTTGGSGFVTLGGGGGFLAGGNGILNITVAHGGGVDTVNLNTGSANISVDGSSSLFLGAGTGNLVLTFLGGGGNATVFGNTGSTTLLGASDSNVVFNGDADPNSNPGSTVYKAGAGNETLDASKTLNPNAAVSVMGSTLTGSNILIKGGEGADTIFSGAGSETMFGGNGRNVFAFSSVVGGASSQTTVEDFNGNDSILLKGYGNTAPTAVQSGQNVTLTLADNTQITFINVLAGAVNSNIHTS